MFRNTFLAFIFIIAPSSLAAAENVTAVLEVADSYRLPSKTARVEVEVALYKNGALDKEKKYTVYIHPGRKSLILFRTPGELGQKAVQDGDRFYMMMPQTKRPIRISPMQKLLGEASVGDVSSMTWSDDYKGAISEPGADAGKDDGIKLTLSASRTGVTYEGVELYVSKGQYKPVKASLYLESGRIAKDVEYVMGKMNGRDMVTGIVITDRIQKNRKTVVKYKSIEAAETPDEYYNPEYLARHNVD